MQRLAISLENENLSAARYDAETGSCKIVKFDEVDHLGMHFRVDASGRPELVAYDEATLHLHVGLDGLTTSEEAGVSVEDLLGVVLKRVKASVGDVSVVVFLGESEPAVLRAAAVRAGFVDIRFIDPVDAVIRKWQWSAPEQADDAMDVVCLTFHNNGLTWDRRIAAEDGAFIRPGAGTANRGCFPPTADGDIHSSLEVFFDWCEKTGGSRYLVVSGTDATRLPPEIASALENHYEVFHTDPLIGASHSPSPSRYERFDEAVADAIAAVDTTDFQTAIAKYEGAKAVFREEPPSELEQLRLRIRHEILKAGARADLASVDTYYELAMALSENLQEKAAVHAECADFYRFSGDRRRAEDEACFAHYMAPEMYPVSGSHTSQDTYQETSETTSETPPNGTSESDSLRWVRFGLGIGIGWWMYRHLLF